MYKRQEPSQRGKQFFAGLRTGWPVLLGYIPVSFAFAVWAVGSGLPWQLVLLISMTNFTSAGQLSLIHIFATVSGLASFDPPPRLLEMFDKARKMFGGALDAYIRRDSALAETVCRSDDEVDALFSASILELCGKISREGAAVPENVDFMFIAKYIERIADHATNVAEWAVFVEKMCIRDRR